VERLASPVERPQTLTLKAICTPAQHRSGRGLTDQMTTLWSSWVIGVVTEEMEPEKPGFGDANPFKVFFGGCV
jgi:hypothetical protein